jgi:hypothetical protein
MIKAHSGPLLLAIAALSLIACGGQPDGAPSENDVSSSAAALTFLGNSDYDCPSCTVPVVGGVNYHLRTIMGVQMHTCNAGEAMIGVNVSSNTFKCAPLHMSGTEGLSGLVRANENTGQNPMLSCPYGQVMTGYHQTKGLVACMTANNDQTLGQDFEEDTSTSSDGHMRVCFNTTAAPGPAGSYAMSGINVSTSTVHCYF